MALLYPRPGELRQAGWNEFDLEQRVWTIPATRSKMRREHRKPLPAPAVAILTELRAHSGNRAFAFPSVHKPQKPLSENTLNASLRRLGYTKDEATSHGFRATASTLLNESGKWSPDAIEAELGSPRRRRGAPRLSSRALLGRASKDGRLVGGENRELPKNTMTQPSLWMNVDTFTVEQAAALWCGLDPSRLSIFDSSNPSEFHAAKQMLTGAIIAGELAANASMNIQSYGGDHSKTLVTRSALEAFARSRNQYPAFLFDTLAPFAQGSAGPTPTIKSLIESRMQALNQAPANRGGESGASQSGRQAGGI